MFKSKKWAALGAGVAVVATAGAMLVGGQPSGAASQLTVGLNGDIHTKTLGLDIPIKDGSLALNVDFSTLTFTGTITVPPTAAHISILGLGLATANVEVVQSAPVTGGITTVGDSATASATIHANVLIKSLTVLGLPFNLVGNNCHTSTPATIQATGNNFSLQDPSVLTSTFTIPSLTNCGLLTPILSALIAGSGNTLTATTS